MTVKCWVSCELNGCIALCLLTRDRCKDLAGVARNTNDHMQERYCVNAQEHVRSTMTISVTARSAMALEVREQVFSVHSVHAVAWGRTTQWTRQRSNRVHHKRSQKQIHSDISESYVRFSTTSEAVSVWFVRRAAAKRGHRLAATCHQLQVVVNEEHNAGLNVGLRSARCDAKDHPGWPTHLIIAYEYKCADTYETNEYGLECVPGLR